MTSDRIDSDRHRGVMTMLIIMAMSLTIALGGCAATSTSTAASNDPLSPAPADFAVDVQVLADTVVDGAPVHHRPARYVLFADGSLHSQIDPPRRVNWRPGLTRRLSREQVASVWSIMQQAGMTDPTSADDIDNLDLRPDPANEIVYLVDVLADGRRWRYERRTPVAADAATDVATDAVMTTLVRRLGQLAWASDLPEDAPRAVPLRYDFGPDPYARYR